MISLRSFALRYFVNFSLKCILRQFCSIRTHTRNDYASEIVVLMQDVHAQRFTRNAALNALLLNIPVKCKCR